MSNFDKSDGSFVERKTLSQRMDFVGFLFLLLSERAVFKLISYDGKSYVQSLNEINNDFAQKELLAIKRKTFSGPI